MAQPVQKLELITQESKEIKTAIIDTHIQEMVIGLCGPIGTDIHGLSTLLERILTDKYSYTVKQIRLSNLIRHYQKTVELNESKDSKFITYQKLINAGNNLRKEHGNSVLAELAINEITTEREIMKKSETYESERMCYIIDSIKNKEELELFRLIYRDIFYFIGVFSPVDLRVQNLIDKGVKSPDVYQLIDRDSGEEVNFGQNVTNTFTDSDFFLRIEANSKSAIEPKLIRFLNLIFSSEVVTPSKDETAMYLASAAAGNSACLSRQVGAAITDSNGEVLSVGWNDVPKAGGSVYKFEYNNSINDRRCFNHGDEICFNDREKDIITNALVSSLVNEKILPESQYEAALRIVRKSRIKELIEFSRAVHAEMLAIILGSQKAGDKVIGGKLYCTTYPCHNCARHIVAAGIKEVYYIEPYRKSLATKLHNDSITENEDAKGDLVKILLFDGISPRRYLEFFKMAPNSRKKDGKKFTIPSKQIQPKNTLSLQAIPVLEGKVTEDLRNKKLIEA